MEALENVGPRVAVEVCKGRIFQARPEKEIEISVRVRPSLKKKLKFWPEPGPARNQIQNFGPTNFFFQFRPGPLGFK